MIFQLCLFCEIIFVSLLPFFDLFSLPVQLSLLVLRLSLPLPDLFPQSNYLPLALRLLLRERVSQESDLLLQPSANHLNHLESLDFLLLRLHRLLESGVVPRLFL